MLELDPEVLDYLSGSGTLVVPTRQRATAVRLAYAAAQLAAGRRCWPTPDVLPWQAWIERSLDAARARGVALPRRLHAAEEWLLWRVAVRAASMDFGVLLPDDLIDAVRAAVALGEDFDIRTSAAASPEAAVLLAATSQFEARCAQLQALGTSQWSRCIEWAAPLAPARLLGFDEPGARRLRVLEQHAVLPWAQSGSLAATATATAIAAAMPDAGTRPGTVEVMAAPDPGSEIHAAARWCREQLQADPAARLLVVLPQLRLQRAAILRAFTDALAPQQITAAGTAAADEPVFALEGGQPLAGYPIVAAALALIELACAPLDSPRWSALLRSPYLQLGGDCERLRLELWLRERNVGRLDGAALQRAAVLLGRRERTASQARLCLQLVQQLRLDAAADAHAVPADWGRRFATLLEGCGWPGTGTLASAEQQQSQRLTQLLGDFAAIGAGAGAMSRREAQQLLQQLAATIAYEPASGDVAVTVTASRADPVVRYDGIWAAGLSAESWPAAAAPEALLPLASQRAAGVPQASAAGQLALAQRQLAQWRHCSRRLALSWSRSVDTVARDPSALLAGFGPAVQLATVRVPSWAQALQRQASFETFTDSQTRPWQMPRLPRGTTALQLQSQCPFRAQAQLRLGAQPLLPPAPGIDPRLRGQLLHGALQRFWTATADLAALQALSPPAEAARVHACVAAAAAELLADIVVAPQPGLWQQELRRSEHVIALLLERERLRAPFSVSLREHEQLWQCGDHQLLLRLDRVDRLADGGSVIIDYKSGAPPRFDAYAPRQPQPQLPAYALGAGVEVVAVALACLGREGSSWRGMADRDGRLEGLRVPAAGEPDWPQLLQQWDVQLRGLVREFAAGHAPVQPQRHACEYCHLALLCRVDRTRLPAATQADEDEDDEGDGEGDAVLAANGEHAGGG